MFSFKDILNKNYCRETKKSLINVFLFTLISFTIIILNYNFHKSITSNNEIFNKKLIPSLEYTINSISSLNKENIKINEIERNLYLLKALDSELNNLDKTFIIFNKYLQESSSINLNETKIVFEELKEEIQNKIYENFIFTEKNSFKSHIITIFYIIFFIIALFFYENKKNKLAKEKAIFYHLSQKDKLTNLYNRHYLESVLSNYDKQKNHISYGIILIDVDDFKQINDKFGHSIGDKVLKNISLILKENIRNMDIIGRWGGEEFICIIQANEKSKLFNIAENLRITIEQSIVHPQNKITASFGCALYNKQKFIEIIKNADKALYIAKRKGKNRVEMNLE